MGSVFEVRSLPRHELDTDEYRLQEVDDRDKYFVPCSRCCPQVNQTVVLVAASWVLISVLLSLVNQWIFHNHVRIMVDILNADVLEEITDM